MSLKPLQATMPLGQFDGLDSELTSLVGGEVVTFGQVVATADLGAADVDGYLNPNLRTVVQLATTDSVRPLMLADEGVTGYGTLFGSIVGSTAGRGTGTVVGPHTALGSGKVTCWAQPGLYAVSLSAMHANVAPTSASVDAGTALHYTSAGKLCLTGDKVGSAPVVARFVEFQDNGSLVTTPNNLVGTFNPPDGAVTSPTRDYDFAVIWFAPPTA